MNCSLRLYFFITSFIYGIRERFPQINSTGLTIALKYENIQVVELIVRYTLEHEPHKLKHLFKVGETDMWMPSLIRMGATNLLFYVVLVGDPNSRLILALRASHTLVQYGKLEQAKEMFGFILSTLQPSQDDSGTKQCNRRFSQNPRTTDRVTEDPTSNADSEEESKFQATSTVHSKTPQRYSHGDCQTQSGLVIEMVRARYQLIQSSAAKNSKGVGDTVAITMCGKFAKHSSQCQHCTSITIEDTDASPKTLKSLGIELADVPFSLIELVSLFSKRETALNYGSFSINNLPNAKDSRMRGPIHWLASAGISKEIFCNLLKQLPSTVVNSDHRDIWGKTPAHYAAFAGHAHIIDVLIQYFPQSIRQSDTEGNTPITVACQNGYLRCLTPFFRVPQVFSGEKMRVACLEAATMRNRTRIAEWLCHTPTENNSTKVSILKKALLAATKSGFEEIALTFLEKLQRLSTKESVLLLYDEAERMSVLHDATLWGFTTLLDHLITPGVEDHKKFRDDMGYTLAHHACIHQRVKTLQLLLLKGCPFNTGDRNGDTPCHWACYSGSSECVQLLIDVGANIHALNRDKGTPLHSAANCGAVQILMKLLEAGSEVDAVMDDGGYPIHNAAYEDNAEFVALLQKHGASNEVSNMENRTPLHDASSTGSHRSMRVLLSEGLCVLSNSERRVIRKRVLTVLLASVNISSNTDCKMMLSKAAKGIEALKKEIQRDGRLPESIALSPTLIYRPLLEACSVLQPVGTQREELGIQCLFNVDTTIVEDIVKMLLTIDRTLVAPMHRFAEGVEESTVDNVDTLWLHYRSQSNQKYSFVCQQDKGGDTALHWALSSNSTKCVKLLLEAQADVHIRNLDGGQPIHAAVINHSAQCLPLLLKAGANPNILFDQPSQGIDQNDIPARFGDTPLHIACRDKDVPCVALLLRGGANPNIVDAKGQSPLHVASELRHLGITELLIQHNANLSIAEETGRTAFELFVGMQGDKLNAFVEKSLNILDGKAFSGCAKFLKDHSFVDLALSTPEGTTFPSHRVILASRCATLAGMLQSGLKESSKDVVNLKMKSPVLRLFLEFIYTNDLPDTSACCYETMLSLIEFADRYALPDLITLCTKRIASKITLETILPIYRIACLYGIHHLQLLCMAAFITPQLQAELHKKKSAGHFHPNEYHADHSDTLVS